MRSIIPQGSGQGSARASPQTEERQSTLLIAWRRERRGDHLDGAEVFVVTDNFVFKSGYCKGSSSSPELHENILHLRLLALKHGFILKVYQVSGDRLIRACIDGLSRGDNLEGIMAGMDSMFFLPFDQGADEWSGGRVLEWVRSWWGPCPKHQLIPEGWFMQAHGEQAYLWIPPPAAMSVVLEQFTEAKHKRPHVFHMFVVPHLMMGDWRKDLSKDVDGMFTVREGTSFWKTNQCEPLIVAISCPLIHRYRRDEQLRWKGPWILQESELAVRVEKALDAVFDPPKSAGAPRPNGMGGDVCKNGLQENPEERGRHLLQEFLERTQSLPALSELLVQRLLRPPPRDAIPK